MKMLELLTTVGKTNTKFIVVTGGVCSSIGKGVLLSSLGVLLKNAGYAVSVLKWDPYLNVDPGTMSPLVHGEVFVTADGAETDLDLGHYERNIGVPLCKDSSVSSGQIYQEVLDGERDGRYLGKCIQLVPHVVDTTKQRLLQFALSKATDFVLLEIGGTVGDMEGEVFLEAVRQLRMELGGERVMLAHLSYVPLLSWTGEVKTKPTQHSVMSLKRFGLAPDCLFLRVDKEIDKQSVDKLAVMCEVRRDLIFQIPTSDPVYRVFLELDAQGVGKKIQHYFIAGRTSSPMIGSSEPIEYGRGIRPSDLSQWRALVDSIDQSTETVSIALIAKYVGSNDPYISVIEAIKCAGYSLQRRVKLVVVEAEALEQGDYNKQDGKAWESLKSVDGIVIPGGFDKRGVEGKIRAARFARENGIPYLGLCLGMQVMVIEAARSLLKLADAHSTEFEPDTKNPVIFLMEGQKRVVRKGGTMRLGSYPCTLVRGTKAYDAYRVNVVDERHRHRYEVNNSYREKFTEAGVLFSGIYAEENLVEITELKDHPFMLGAQFHPEFQSQPLKVHPLFRAFMEAVVRKSI